MTFDGDADLTPEETEEALAVLEQKPPEGVPEVVTVKKCNGCLQPSIMENFNARARYRYRFDGIVEPGVGDK